MAYPALTIAKYFLSLSDENSGDLISNLKLQKLLYYAQGFYVAVNGVKNPLFEEDIFAWKHGPVVRSVYKHYNKFKGDALPIEKAPTSIAPKDVRFLDEIYRVFGKFSAWKLREMTHREPPWKENYEPDVNDIQITLKDLREYFKQHVKT
jgi:uncharacterized phage-associated protein